MTQEEIEKIAESDDEYAEVPEEILDAKDLKELEEVKKETEGKVYGGSVYKRRSREEEGRDALNAWNPKTKLGQDVRKQKLLIHF